MAPLSNPSPRAAQLTDALLQIAAERGLEQVSVREVATAAGVSIGTVQHHFPTKDAMLAAAFEEVVRRIRARIAAVPLGDDVRRNLLAVLGELLPLDVGRAAEVRVQVAFGARAAHAPTLAAIQRRVLGESRAELAEAFAAAWGVDAGAARCEEAARVALAAADGLALHAISSADGGPPELSAPLELLIDALLQRPAGP